jgi:hypothetical protein
VSGLTGVPGAGVWLTTHWSMHFGSVLSSLHEYRLRYFSKSNPAFVKASIDYVRPMPTTLGMTGPNASLTAGVTVTFTAGAWYM